MKAKKYINQYGQEVKTILPDQIMDKISDLIEIELKAKKIFYQRNGTIFTVTEDNISDLYKAQINADKKLLKEGIITMEMLLNDHIHNFSPKN